MAVKKLSPELARLLKSYFGFVLVGTGRAAIDFAPIATILQTTGNIAVAGALLGDVVLVGCETALTAGLQLSGIVGTADQATVVVSNNTAGTIDEASHVYTVIVLRRN